LLLKSAWKGFNMRQPIFVLLAVLTLGGCSERSAREPTDEELKAFFEKLDADARKQSAVSVIESRRVETERASAAEGRLESSAKERQGQVTK
jgi:hypothetical protein